MAINALDILLPKKKSSPAGTSPTPTFNPASPSVALAKPSFTEHMDDVFDSRQANDSRALLQLLFRQDPDVSAAVFAYLTVASSAAPWWVVYDQDNIIDRDGQKQLEILMQSLFGKNDYTLGFQLKPSLTTMLDELRYTLLLRGVIMNELIIDKNFLPSELRHTDSTKVSWYEQTAGKYKPSYDPGTGNLISLDIPTFFVQFYKRDPSSIYSYSPFVSAINTIAARQQVVNDLYRIMKKTGYPRQSIKVVEDVLRKNAPQEAQVDPVAMNAWMKERLNEISATITDLSVSQVYVHTDSIEPGMLNEKAPGMELDITPVIDVLNAQNQAALKTMATIIGRGESGVNTASVESRVFSMHADSLNDPIAQLMSDVLTFCLRLNGSTSRVEFGFDKVELRPSLELENSMTMRQNRLMSMLSIGLITDDEFHLEMFSRPRPDNVPELSGTQFMDPTQAVADVPSGTQPSATDKQVNIPGNKMANSSASTKKKAAT